MGVGRVSVLFELVVAMRRRQSCFYYLLHGIYYVLCSKKRDVLLLSCYTMHGGIGPVEQDPAA